MHTQRGFTLVELMVGLVIGLIVSLAALTSMITFGASQRRDVGDDGALENASIFLFSMASEVKNSGLSPLDFNGALLCPSFNLSTTSGTILDGAPAYPVVITAGGAGSDRINVAYSNTILGRSGTRLLTDMTAPDSDLLVASASGFNNGDVIAVGTPGAGTPCTVMQISAIGAVGSNASMAHAAGGGLAHNPANPAGAYTNAPAYPAGSVVFGSGGFTDVTYQVGANGLRMTDNLAPAGTTSVIADNVVYLKAQYGVTTAPGQPTKWVSAATAPWDNLTPAVAAQITALHVGVVVRNPQRIQPTVHGGACDATAPADTTRVLWVNTPAGVNDPAVNLATLLTPVDAEWACYKYRTFDLVIPLKNILFR